MSIYATIEMSKSGHQKLPKEFDPKKEGFVYGQNLPKMDEKLDKLAKRLKVTPITEFFDDSEMLTDEEREEVGLPPAKAKWASVEDGLRTVQALIGALRKAGAGEMELWDLVVSEAILKKFVGKGEKFRYSVL